MADTLMAVPLTGAALRAEIHRKLYPLTSVLFELDGMPDQPPEGQAAVRRAREAVDTAWLITQEPLDG